LTQSGHWRFRIFALQIDRCTLFRVANSKAAKYQNYPAALPLGFPAYYWSCSHRVKPVVSLPSFAVFSTLVRTGTISDQDITGEQTYVLADGSKGKSVTFTIRSLRVGDKIVENVRGAVAPAKGALLLGQSFLERFKSWSFDNTKHQLVLEVQ
jgi:hypothetical protein